MIIYLEHDTEPLGGFLSAQDHRPDIARLRSTVDEIREVHDFPADVWRFVLEGGLPVDSDGSNDSTWIEWWYDGETIWSRDSG